MTRIALVRHGATALNLGGRIQGESEAALATEGVHQAERAADALASCGLNWCTLTSSPQRRARETAAHIGTQLGLAVQPSLDELCERRYGAAEGLTFAELYERWQVPMDDRGRPGVLDRLIAAGLVDRAEPIESVRARGVRALADLAGMTVSEPDAGVIAVAHGTFIRCTLEAIGHAEPVHIENGGVVVLAGDGASGWQVDRVFGQPSVH